MLFPDMARLIPPGKRISRFEALELLGTPFDSKSVFNIELVCELDLFKKDSKDINLFGLNEVLTGNINRYRKNLFYFAHKVENRVIGIIPNLRADEIYIDEVGRYNLLHYSKYDYKVF